MRHPRAIVAGLHFAQLIGAYFFKGNLVSFRVAFDGNLSRHTAHGVDTAAMASLDQQIDVRLEEVPRHGDLGAIGKNAVRGVAKLFYETEDVIPSAAVEAGGMLAQLIENFVHLER